MPKSAEDGMSEFVSMWIPPFGSSDAKPAVAIGSAADEDEETALAEEAEDETALGAGAPVADVESSAAHRARANVDFIAVLYL